MTYKEIVDRFETVADSHYMINDFGYGQLSDIKVRSQDQEADYPYMFLNPTTHNRNGVVLSYNFNLIMMDIATDEGDEHSNFLAIQSKCTQYIDDVIAELYYGYQDKPEINMSNINYTVFKERFQDSVAGVTATITIDVPTPINLCIAPIAPPPVPPVPPATELLIFEGNYIPRNIEYDGGALQVQQPYIVYDDLELGGGQNGVELQINFGGDYRIVFDAVVQNKITETFYQSQVAICPTECFIDPPLRWHLMKDIFFPNTPTEVIGFPWTFNAQTNVDIPVQYDFIVTLQALKYYKFDFSTTASPYTDPIISIVSGSIKMYKQL
jgi:hypothetical protein